MVDKKYIEHELSEVQLLSQVTEAYALISSYRMRNIRKSVISNREFLDSIDEIFKEVLSSYRRETKGLNRKRSKSKGITFLSHNGRSAAVFLSANARLYGQIIPDTFNLFIEDVRKNFVEATIVGRYGLRLFREAEPDRQYTYYDFPDHGMNLAQLKSLVDHLVQYEEIRLYYPKFQNIITQAPSMYKVSAGTSVDTSERDKKPVSYLFEPTLEDIMIFFETQIFGSMFEQTIRESQLAKNASRLLSMDQAHQRASSRARDLNFDRLRFNHKIINKRQMGVVTSNLFYGK